MDAARYQRLMALFDALCEADPATRTTTLRRLEAREPALAAELRALLAADAAPLSALEEAQAPELAPPPLPPRYTLAGFLGRGGMGAVWRVYDGQLTRHLALKVIHEPVPALQTRFVEEARVVAQLQHPAIVPIHDLGTLSDGRCYFTMREVPGETWHDRLRDGAADDPVWRRDQLQVLLQVCRAVAFAHQHGVIHRDLKPDNVMIGPLGDVLVLDWGLARVLQTSPVRSAQRASGALPNTGGGIVMGTPRYMAPEQALGQTEAVGPATDVYALGAMLYTVLAGAPPYDATSTPATVIAGPPPPLPARAPEALRQICAAAMARDRLARPADAGVLAERLANWLSGAADRARALALVAEAEALAQTIEALTAEAAARRVEADALLAAVSPWSPAAEKAAGWAKEDAAKALEARVALREAERLRCLHTALHRARDLPAARAALADHHQAQAAAAEARGDATTAAVHLDALRQYDDGRHAAWIEGTAQLSIHTSAPAAVSVHRWRTVTRRQVLGRAIARHRTPCDPIALPAGDYLLQVHAPAGPIRAAISLGRLEARRVSVPLPPADLLADGWCLVPGGPFVAGGDPNAPDAFAATLVDVPGFVVRRDPVTNAEFIAFLDDLVATGRAAEAERWAPREPASGSSAPVYQRTPSGGFAVGQDAEGNVWTLDQPVVQITWHAAMAWCAWEAARTGHPWRLLHELEWEKAARGSDGRGYPWGDAFDPSWARSLQSVDGRPGRCAVTAYPSDLSPYGVRGLGGNVRDLCLNPYFKGAPPARLVVSPPAPDDTRLRSTRGGSFYSQPHFCRAATRFAGPVDQGFASVGFRVGFSWPTVTLR